jgi:hypothetical protein
MSESIQLTIRISSSIHAALSKQARAQHSTRQLGDHISYILASEAIASGYMDEDDAECLKAHQKMLKNAREAAIRLHRSGHFGEHFTRDVFRAMMNDLEVRATYEKAIGGDAYADKLEGKMPLNMYLGWEIKNAVGASVQKNEDGKPRRASVRNEAIKTYTLLEPTSA